MIFLTVGSSLPFDRLVRMIDDAVVDASIEEEVFGQIGGGSYTPRGFAFTRFLGKQRYNECFDRATAIISHAGIGTISHALKLSKPILVMPRQKALRELVDDHQLMTAERFSDLGHVLAFSSHIELMNQLPAFGHFQPKVRRPNVEGISAVVNDYLNGLVSTNHKR